MMQTHVMQSLQVHLRVVAKNELFSRISLTLLNGVSMYKVYRFQGSTCNNAANSLHLFRYPLLVANLWAATLQFHSTHEIPRTAVIHTLLYILWLLGFSMDVALFHERLD